MNDIEKAIEDIKTLQRDLFGDSDGFEMWRDFETSIPLAISALEKQLNNGWIPVSKMLPSSSGGWIPFKAEYDEDNNMYMLQGEIPDDEQEILVTDGKSVWNDTFMRDGMECYLDSGDDLIITVKAWMKLPEPYKEAENEVYI